MISDSQFPDAYKAFCADVTSTLREYRRLSGQLDSDDGISKAIEGDYSSLFQEFEAQIVEDWSRFSHRGTELCLPYMNDLNRLTAIRRFTQRLVTVELMEGAVWRRAFEKPRGYPGDYGVMNYFYESTDVGESTYARLCHRLGLNFASCVRTRKDVVKQTLLERLADGKPVSCTSIACGSAQEIFEIAEQPDIPGPLMATLLDQDAEALSFATARLAGNLVRHRDNLTIQARAGDLSTNGSMVPDMQDLIYCFGMFDYLPDETVSGITKILYDKLGTGGCLILGNLKKPTDMVWGMSIVLGYDMWYRSEEELHALACPLAGARSEVRLESTGQNYLLFVHKS